MKKSILIFAIVLTTISSIFSQTKSETLSKFELKNPHLEADYTKIIDIDRRDTTYKVLITSVGCLILFSKQEELSQFVNDLKKALQEIGNKTNLDFDREKYHLSLSEKLNTLMISSNIRSSRYSCLDSKQTKKLIEWIETIKINK